MKLNPFKLFISIAICQMAGVVGSFFTASSIATWYAALNKPAFSPPNWLFGPAWIILYFLMGVSLYIVWESRAKGKKTALAFFSAQLALNALWPVIFFGLKSPLLAFIVIIALWLAILLTILKFYRISGKAAYLLMPYILWVSFAAILNLAIVFLNR